jgi:hypothetical protein
MAKATTRVKLISFIERLSSAGVEFRRDIAPSVSDMREPSL